LPLCYAIPIIKLGQNAKTTGTYSITAGTFALPLHMPIINKYKIVAIPC